mgnify:CR=1 FL=1
MTRRRFLARLGSASAAGLAAGLLTGCGGPVYNLRFRLTVEVQTPEGVKSGSSVIDMQVQDDTKVSYYPMEARLFRRSLSGEAMFVDLGSGRHVIGLLDFSDEIVERVYGLQPAEQYARYRAMKGVREIPARTDLSMPLLRPTIVTFKDLADPASAVVIFADSSYTRFAVDRFAEAFGPGYALKRVTIEMTADPVTRGIEGKLPHIIQKLDQDRKVFRTFGPNDPYLPQLGQFRR